MGGLVEVIMGTSNLKVFGIQVSSFATSLGNAVTAFRNTPIEESDIENIQKVCDVTNKLAELSPNIEPMGGFVDALMGSNDLASFGATLTPFVIGLGSASIKIVRPSFASSTATETDTEVFPVPPF